MKNIINTVDISAMTLTDKGLHLIKGPNGTGKSLMLKKIFSENKGKISLMNQGNDQLDKSKTALENLTMGQVDESYVISFIESYEKGYLLKKKVKEFSGGERRLLTFFRTALSPMPILAFDEPTNDLDYKAVKVVLSVLENLKKEKCLLVVSHDSRISDAEYSYKVDKKKLYLKSKKPEQEPDFKTRKLKLNKSKSKNVFSVLIFIVLMIFALHVVLTEGRATMDTEYENLPKNEYYIASQFSGNIMEYSTDGVSTAIIRASLHLSQDKSEVPIALNIKEVKQLTPLEYYNLETGQYRKATENSEVSVNEVMTEAKVEKEASQSFLEFFTKNDFTNQEIMIKGYDISKLLADANRSMGIYILVRFSAFAVLILFLLCLIIVYINEKNYKAILKNKYFYGFDLKELLLERQATYGFNQNKRIVLVLVSLLSLFSYLLMKTWIALALVLSFYSLYLIIVSTLKMQIRFLGKRGLYDNEN